MIRAAAITLAGLAQLSAAGAAQPSIKVNDPRPFGYFLGDQLRRQITVDVPPGMTLRMNALPQPGPRDYWLDLVAASTAPAGADGTQFRIELMYQIFYSALEPKRLRIPGFKLYFEGWPQGEVLVGKEQAAEPAQQTSSLSVPAFEFVVSPIREIMAAQSAESGGSFLRPDAAALPIGTGAIRTGLLASAFAGVAALLALAYSYAWFPFHKRRARPFTRAARQIGGAGSQYDDTAEYQREMLLLHRAFDEVYGRRLLANDVEDFLHRKHHYAPAALGVQKFFQASELIFFSGKPDFALRAFSSEDLGDLAYQLARLERLAA